LAMLLQPAGWLRISMGRRLMPLDQPAIHGSFGSVRFGCCSGRLAVAERHDDNSPAFQCRDKSAKILSPTGTVEKPYGERRPEFVEVRFSRPCGTCFFDADDPALKRRAIIGLSRWDERRRTFTPHSPAGLAVSSSR
jgi:hypothetical protein